MNDMSTNKSITNRPMHELKYSLCVPLHMYNEGVYLYNVSTLIFHFYPTLSIELEQAYIQAGLILGKWMYTSAMYWYTSIIPIIPLYQCDVLVCIHCTSCTIISVRCTGIHPLYQLYHYTSSRPCIPVQCTGIHGILVLPMDKIIITGDQSASLVDF